jgi:elongation factor Ts
MPAFSAKDVQKLRQLTGVGMLDARRALEENDGDMDRSITWLRTEGLASQAKRSDREASEGAVAVGRSGDVASIVQLRSETDFVAKSDEFVALVDSLAELVAAKGERATEELSDELERLRVTLKENISIGRRGRFLPAPSGRSWSECRGGRTRRREPGACP